MTTSGLLGWIIVWAAAAVGTVAFRAASSRRETGLVWAYLANLWLLHWPAAVSYTLPWYSPIEFSTVYEGFKQSAIGVVAFGVGAAFLAPFVVGVLEPPGGVKAERTGQLPDALLPRSYLIIGILAYAVLVPLARMVPTFNAVAVAATQLVVVGICLRCWHGWFTRNNWMFYSALAVAAIIPFATVLGQGFLGYGAASVMTILCFNGSFIRPRWKVAVAGVLVAYLGFSAFVTYMRDRGEIREVVWGGESVTHRITSVLSSVRNTELFDPRDPNHLQRIELRLNQNYLVGASVEMIESGARVPARGETVWQALLGLVPRAIWAEKPVYAGSPGIVSEYTGISFAQGTSVGVGQVMEFFINFRLAGVIVGFLLLGTLIGMFDTWAAERLWQGDWMRFAMWFLAGLGFIQAGGSLVEVMSTVAAGLLAAVLVNKYVIPLLHRGEEHRGYPLSAPIPAQGPDQSP
jgi:hypothetical protein